MHIGKKIGLDQHYGLLYMELQIQQRVRLRFHQGKSINSENNARRSSLTTSSSTIKSRKTINSENNTRRFRNVEQFSRCVRSMQSNTKNNTKTEVSIKEIDVQETDDWTLTIVGNGQLTGLLETLIGWSSTIRLYTLYHHLFGRIYLKRRKDPIILTSSKAADLKGHLYLYI